MEAANRHVNLAKAAIDPAGLKGIPARIEVEAANHEVDLFQAVVEPVSCDGASGQPRGWSADSDVPPAGEIRGSTPAV